MQLSLRDHFSEKSEANRSVLLYPSKLLKIAPEILANIYISTLASTTKKSVYKVRVIISIGLPIITEIRKDGKTRVWTS